MADNKGVVYLGPGKVAVQDLGYPKLEVPGESPTGSASSAKRRTPSS